MSFSSNLNSSVVKTELDDVFYAAHDGALSPHHAGADDALLFNQSSADSAAVIMEEFKGVGYWDERAEEENVNQADPRIDNQQTFNVLNYAKSIDVPKNMFDDAKHDAVNRMIADFGETARLTKEQTAMGVYRDATSGNTYTTNAGTSLVNDSHTNMNGDTVDNKGTAALAPTALETGIVALQEQKAQDGTIRGHMPAALLVPPALFKEAVEVTESQLLPGTADNEINWVSAKYGLQVKTSPFLGAAAGGSDTAWFLLARNHGIFRWVRQGLQTALVDWRFERNNNYVYKGEYREVYGGISYDGLWGSDGSA